MESIQTHQIGRPASLNSQRNYRDYERFVGTTLDKFLDAGHGSCVLRQSTVRDIVYDGLLYFDGVRMHVGDLVVMPNHVHALMTPMLGYELEDILHSIKSFTSNRINESLGLSGTFWQRESYDHIVRDGDQLEAFQRYIALNPTKANLDNSEFTHRKAKYRFTP